MNSQAISISDNIPGVFQARQRRSVRIRDNLINFGVESLNDMRFSELTISGLTQSSGHSVGAFYARFKDKDAFFRALRVYTILSLENEVIARFSPALLEKLSPRETLECLVDLMVDIFTSRFRGVLRESLVLILEPDDPWAPMRGSALKIVATLQDSLSHEISDRSADLASIQLRFCFQLIVGALQNDLVNDHHVFTTTDDSLRDGLKEAVCAYMNFTEKSGRAY